MLRLWFAWDRVGSERCSQEPHCSCQSTRIQPCTSHLWAAQVSNISASCFLCQATIVCSSVILQPSCASLLHTHAVMCGRQSMSSTWWASTVSSLIGWRRSQMLLLVSVNQTLAGVLLVRIVQSIRPSRSSSLDSCSGLYLNWLSSNIESTSLIILPKLHLSFNPRNIWRHPVFSRWLFR